jgi:hypothetical protein
MALSENQLKNPHRSISSSNSMSYLERSFASPAERADEVRQWWESGIVEKLFRQEKDSASDGFRASHFLGVAAQGLPHLPPEERIPAWERLLKAGGEHWALSYPGKWMTAWTNDPDLLLWGLKQGYSPFGSRSRVYSDVWETVARRVGGGKRKPGDLDFLQAALDSPHLTTTSQEERHQLFDHCCWLARGDNVEWAERAARAFFDAGLDPEKALNEWACRLRSNGHIANWVDWVVPGGVPLKISTEGLSAIMNHPEGIGLAQRLWAAGMDAFPVRSYSLMSSRDPSISSPWFDLLLERKSDLGSAEAWTKAVFAAIDRGVVAPPSETWLSGLLKAASEDLPKQWQDAPRTAWKAWLTRIPAWAEGQPNIGYLWSKVVSPVLDDARTWEEKTTALKGLVPWISESPWLVLTALPNDSAFQNLWIQAVSSDPRAAKALNAQLKGVFGPLSWGALVGLRNLRDDDMWFQDRTQDLLALAKGSASALSPAVLENALEKGSARLIQVLLEDGAPACSASTLWQTVKSRREAWRPPQILELVRVWKEFVPTVPVWEAPEDAKIMWQLLYRNERTSAEVVQGLISLNAPLPSSSQLIGAPQGKGNELLSATVREQELGVALPEAHVSTGPKAKVRF